MGPGYFCASTIGTVILTHFDGSWHGREGPRTMQRNGSFETFAHHLPMDQRHLDEWVQPQFWPQRWISKSQPVLITDLEGLKVCINQPVVDWHFPSVKTFSLPVESLWQASPVSCLLQELRDPWMQTNRSTRTIHWVFSWCSGHAWSYQEQSLYQSFQ